ncbi:hypothetical protein BGX33_007803 [Mortierella sp. NVP41]|nr:hypothetical protein BGX33_007803 [Mortierella sp. NVP41]
MMATITAMTSTSTLTGRQASFKSSAPMPGTLTRKSGNVKRNLQLADTASGGGRGGASPTQDASGIVSIQLGRLLISTRQHVRGTDIDSDTDLLLESGMAGGQSVTLNPDIHLGPLSTTPLASGTTTPASTTPLTATTAAAGHSTIPMDDHDGAAAVDLYRSTIEFLALMTAFVSVVCWLMQIRLLDAGHPNRPHHDQDSSASAMEGVDMEQDGSESGRRNRCAQLREFLGLFDDLDNVLNPIKEALSRTTTGSQHQWHHDGEEESDSGLDPMDSVGLFAWHYFLFASDRESPFEREAHAINIPSLHSVHFDVILNELYTTHILSMTAKEHQKDHGQFYTPPGVVDFMWKRTVMDRGHLLDQFVESLPSSLSALASHPQHDSWEPLIPTALDPCLGVSTFLSCYVRLLIQEAQQVHADTIWRSEAACRLLLAQICEHVWGIELDGFAFWMARCGILVALMPLVQHVQTFSHHPQQQPQQQLPRLHLFRSDTLQLTVPDGESLKAVWDRQCILQLRNSSRLQFDFIVTNPPYMIRKTGTFSAPDPEVYDWSILGASIATASSAAASAAADPPEGSSSTPKSKSRSSTKASRATFEEEGRLTPVTVDTGDDDDSGSEATMTPSGGRSSKSASESTLHSSRMKKIATQVRPTGSKGMMQAYGYFVWFAAQRIKPGKGVVCMITASQWLTLEFAVKLRAWLFGNCLMDEFFQFEPYKVFSKVQTDSLIFKIRAIPPDLLSTTSSPQSSSPLPLGDHRTVFLRHTDHHKPLAGILQDYMAFSTIEDALIPPSSSSTSFTVESSNSNNSDLNIMASSKTREELAAVIMAPSATPITSAITSGSGAAGSDGTTAPATYTYSFAPMMPSSVLTTFMLALTQDLGALCSAGTKKVNRLHAVEPLLWHRGPNTNPVYGLVVRMEYARAMFGKEMTRRWFRPALYWNGKNSPEGPPTAASSTVPSKALHREGQFWQGRDRQRLSKKEGSPAESYTVPTSDPQRLYALCMVDKESVKVLRQQVEQKVEGSQALWNYLTDVRTHFQPGLASKRKVASSGKQQAVDDEGVAFCSTNQCGADVPEKIVHPINYGYFSKTQPRQRFFLDTDSLAVTNQCIYLTLNTLSSHYDAEQCPPLVYFLTLLNSTTLQFFVLHHCQYDQQGRMRLFRESMAKIPFQDRDVKNHPERIQYVAQLGTCMIELKDILYRIVAGWRLTGSHHGSSNTGTSGGPAGRRGSAGGLGPNIASPAGASATATTTPSTGGGGNQGLLDWIRKGGNPPPGLLSRVKEQVRRMLIAQASRHRHHYQPPVATTSMGAVHPTSAHVTPTTLRLAPSSSILHLTKPRDTKTRTMGGALFPDTDTDTNTFTDTDTDTDDAMDPWVASRRGGKASTRMGRGVITAANTTPGYHLPQKPGSGGGQGQHSLARILNMPGDDETSMDEEGSTMTDSPLTMPRPMPIPEASRDRRVLHPLGGFGQDEDFEEGETVLAKGITTITSTNAVMETDMDEYRHPSSTSSTTTTTAAALDDQHQHQHPHRQQQLSFDQQISIDCDRILQAIERAVTMIEMVQWAVDQYGYMLYGIRPKFQKLLELELKIVYGARLESLIIPISPPATATTAASTTAGAASFGDDGQAQGQGQGQGQDRSVENLALSLGITVWDLYRWEGDSDTMAAPLLTPAPTTTLSSGASVSSCPVPEPGSGPTRSYGSGGGSGGGSAESSKALPRYAFQVLENAQSATQLLREIFEQFPSLPSAS